MDGFEDRLQRLRRNRNRPIADLSLRPILQEAGRKLRRDHKQLQAVTPVWEQCLPLDVLTHTRLEGLSRGVLRVAVDSSSQLYRLDVLLRQGLQTKIITQCRGAAIRSIQLRLAPMG